MKRFIYVLSFALIAASCAPNAGSDEGTSETEEVKGENCYYTFNADSTNMTWTGYKFTEKVGVSGTFTEIVTANIQNSPSIIDAVANAEFKIPITSVESNNEDRNKKIIDYFFGSINTEVIYGRVAGLSGTEESGQAEIIINMNNQDVQVFMPYTFQDGILNMSAVIDIFEWNGQMGVERLNEACYDLHKSADGVSKLWPDVKIELNAVFDTVCE